MAEIRNEIVVMAQTYNISIAVLNPTLLNLHSVSLNSKKFKKQEHSRSSFEMHGQRPSILQTVFSLDYQDSDVYCSGPEQAYIEGATCASKF